MVAPFLIASAVALLYFGWLYYVEFDHRAIHQTKYFGFGDKHFDLVSVTHVFLSEEPNVFMMPVAAVNIRAGHDEIRLLTTAYSRNGLVKLVTALRAAGAPIDAAVLHELRL